MLMLFVVLSIIVLANLINYIFLIPDCSQQPLKPSTLDTFCGKVLYGIAYLLSLLRAPPGLIPYLVKIGMFFVLKIRYESARSTYVREILNMLGDFLNIGLIWWFIMWLVGPLNIRNASIIFYLPIGAELIRIAAERIPIIFSAGWQLMPHRIIARYIAKQSSPIYRILARCLVRYCHYYALEDQERASYLLAVLKYRASLDADLLNRLEYMRSFRIVPLKHGLRSGHVRDVAKGEVFIHAIWTNDPWLLIGMAIRRSRWMFDRRYLHRPFYYMTDANRLATLCILEHARYSLPFAIFQFGHEIRVARLHFFYGLLRLLGLDIEEKVQANGIFQFDQFICWLEQRAYRTISPRQYLFTDEETIADISRRHSGESISPLEIATRYTYPLKYVEEVLLSRLEQAQIMCQTH